MRYSNGLYFHPERLVAVIHFAVAPGSPNFAPGATAKWITATKRSEWSYTPLEYLIAVLVDIPCEWDWKRMRSYGSIVPTLPNTFGDCEGKEMFGRTGWQ